MKRLIFTALLIFLLAPVPLSGEEGGKSFTNQDLEKYRRSSDSPSPVRQDQGSTVPEFTDIPLVNSLVGQIPKRYVIPYRVSEGTEMRIIIPVTFDNRFQVNMLLDTGATGMHISYRLAEKIGIFERDKTRLLWAVGGIGGVIPAVVTVIDSITVGEIEYDFIPTTVSPSISANFEGIIGMDFMTNYSIHIDTQKHVVMFEELPESRHMPDGRSETWWRVTFRRFKAMRSAWENYRSRLEGERGYSNESRDLQKLADWQYEKARDLFTKLNVYASTHSVPLEWR